MFWFIYYAGLALVVFLFIKNLKNNTKICDLNRVLIGETCHINIDLAGVMCKEYAQSTADIDNIYMTCQLMNDRMWKELGMGSKYMLNMNPVRKVKLITPQVISEYELVQSSFNVEQYGI